MNFIELTPFQKKELSAICPIKKIADYCFFLTEEEYLNWYMAFYNFYLEISSVFELNVHLRKSPVLQCVAKLEDFDGVLKPKTFKFAYLPEGTMRGFGFSPITASLLQIVANTFPVKITQFPFKYKKQNTSCLGYQAWNEKDPSPHIGDRYLSLYMNCAANPHTIKIVNNKIIFNQEEYDYLLPTFNYHQDSQFQILLQKLQERKLLLFPLDFPLGNLRNLIGFESEYWAEVKSLEYFLEEDPAKLSEYVLIRTDNGNILTWEQVQSDPLLKLEIEMDDYWVWQKKCISPFENINLYWTFGFDYPWLVDNSTGEWISVFIIQK